MKKKRLIALRITALLALVLVLAMDVAFVVMRDRAFSPMENRTLEQMPQLSWHGITSGRYEARFDDYVSDQFPLRDQWVTVKAAIDRMGGRTDSNGVYLGQDGWLIQDFAEPTEAQFVTNTIALRDFLKRHEDMPRYLMVVPTAVTVYRDKLPAFAPAGDEGGYIDRLYASLSDTGANLIDLRPAFYEQAEATQLYYRTDHHWTTDGAYLAYLRLAEQANLAGADMRYSRRLLSNHFSGTLTASSGYRTGETDDIAAYIPQEEQVQYVVNYMGDEGRSASFYKAENLDVHDQYTVFLGGNHPQIRVETTADNGRHLMVLKDSYANCFIPFLVQDYEKLLIIDPRYYTGDLETLMSAEGINEILVLYNASTLAGDTSLRQDIGAR